MVPVAVGELIDKITILRLKCTHLRSPEAVTNVHRELKALEAVHAAQGAALQSLEIQHLTEELQTINHRLWDVEDSLRILESKQCFDHEFILLARSVYQLNDQRAAIKRRINETCGSDFIEEKSYGAIK